MQLRSPLGRVIGLGSAREGVSHWWWQRLTGLALVPLGIWFVILMLRLIGADHGVVTATLKSPTQSALMILFVVCVFHHAQLGLQVVIEDYVGREGIRVAALISVKFASVFLALVGIVSVLQILAA